jgi:undecaprenyl diphosphate synthase
LKIEPMSNAVPAADQQGRSDGPLHVAIIMDGNGRWAASRGLPRAEGHRRGVEALRRVVRAAHELGVIYLTIFSFSSENWSRPASEIGDLFGLLRRFIRNDLASLHGEGVRVRVIGERAGLDPDICALLNEAEELTRDNTRLNLVVAFNYGSRQEIAAAARRLAREVADGKRDPASIDADALGQYLDAPDIPDPDLIIRTSGEQRLSNFLMWQARSRNMQDVSAALAGSLRKPDRERASQAGGSRTRSAQSDAAHRRRLCAGAAWDRARLCRRLVVGHACDPRRRWPVRRMAVGDFRNT